VDLQKTIRELHEEKQRLDRVIESLEQLLGAGVTESGDVGTEVRRSRRGRKSMSEQERRQVSERMARYWAGRRAAEGGRGKSSDSSGS